MLKYSEMLQYPSNFYAKILTYLVSLVNFLRNLQKRALVLNFSKTANNEYAMLMMLKKF
jgi:hypothetical protein